MEIILSDQEILNILLNKTVTSTTTVFTTTTTVSATTASSNIVSTLISATLTDPKMFTLYQKWVLGILVFVAIACLLVIILVLVCLKQMCMPIKAVI
jgi:hypothetical protein